MVAKARKSSGKVKTLRAKPLAAKQASKVKGGIDPSPFTITKYIDNASPKIY